MTRTYLENIYTRLSNIAPTVVMDVSAPPPRWQEHLDDVSQIFDKKQLIDDYWKRIEHLKQKLGDHRLQMQVSVATIGQGYQITTYRPFQKSTSFTDPGFEAISPG